MGTLSDIWKSAEDARKTRLKNRSLKQDILRNRKRVFKDLEHKNMNARELQRREASHMKGKLYE